MLQDVEKVQHYEYKLEMLQSDKERYKKMIRDVESRELLNDVGKENGIRSPEDFFPHYDWWKIAHLDTTINIS